MGNFTEALDRATTAALDLLLAHLPQLLGALALLLVRSTGQARWRIGHSASVLGAIVYWVVLLLFVTAATQTLGLQTFTDWLTQLVDYLPTLAAGLLIIVAGYLLSGFVAELVKATATGLAPPQRDALARLAQGATLIMALLVGADQIGLKVTWIAIFAAVLVGSLIGGLTIAISLGARGYVSNLIGAHYLRQSLHVGQHVRVAGHEGHIIDVTATSLVLETDTGRILLPGRIYHDEAIVLITRHDNL